MPKGISKEIELLRRILKLREAIEKAIGMCNTDMKEEILQEALDEDNKECL